MLNWFRSFLANICAELDTVIVSHGIKHFKLVFHRSCHKLPFIQQAAFYYSNQEANIDDSVRCPFYAGDLVLWTEVPKKNAKTLTENKLKSALAVLEK
ncbi:hypothetical protein CEXT_631521 [Caerostris extrusa]|uniref:Uncharacterized protein n=1 Tax=Caerostris extrusa TaxID=172846 RepID=A0AAV4RX86_CAEEX|nr:hypothetical protein CEXT_631521 [Caerostris extrusa]